MLGLVLTLTLAAPLDAPLQLSLRDVDRRMFEVEARASNAKVSKGLGVVAVVLGSASGVGYIAGTVSNGIAHLGDSLAQSLTGGPGLPQPNFTPLLVGALMGLSVGFAATFFGISVGESAASDRVELEKARAVALAELMRTAQSAPRREAPAVAPEPVPTELTPPPLPAPDAAPRKPLVPRR